MDYHSRLQTHSIDHLVPKAMFCISSAMASYLFFFFFYMFFFLTNLPNLQLLLAQIFYPIHLYTKLVLNTMDPCLWQNFQLPLIVSILQVNIYRLQLLLYCFWHLRSVLLLMKYT